MMVQKQMPVYGLVQLPIDRIRPNPYQPRRIFDEQGLMELAESLREYGLIQPVTVRRMGNFYELIAGERRLRAAKIAGWQKIDAIILPAGELDSAIAAMIENLQRETLHFLEEAEGLQALLLSHKITQQQLARSIGKTQSYVANKLRLLKLEPDVLHMIRINDISERHARTLLPLSFAGRKEAVERIVTENLSVRETEELVERMQKSIPPIHKFRMIFDHRVYINEIRSAVKQMRQAGAQIALEERNADDSVELVITLKKIRQNA